MVCVPLQWLVACMQDLEVAQKLSDAIARSLSSDAHQFTRVVAKACLMNGFSSCSRGYQLVPVSCSTIGAVVKKDCPGIPGKLIANLQQQKCQRFFRIVPGPAGTQPAVLLDLTATIDKPYSKAVAKIMNKVYSSSEHPSNGNQLASCDDAGSIDSDADTSQVQYSSVYICLCQFMYVEHMLHANSSECLCCSAACTLLLHYSFGVTNITMKYSYTGAMIHGQCGHIGVSV